MGSYSQSAKEIPQSNSLAPRVEEIISAVCKFYDIDEIERLGYKKRGGKWATNNSDL